jgi:hypothetical protein
LPLIVTHGWPGSVIEQLTIVDPLTNPTAHEDFKGEHAVHTLAVDLNTHRVYVPEHEVNGKPVAKMVVYDAVTAQ